MKKFQVIEICKIIIFICLLIIFYLKCIQKFDRECRKVYYMLIINLAT